MSALQRTRLGVSRRDVGAGLVGGVAALLANVLFHAALFLKVFAEVAFTDPASALSILRWDPLTVSALVVTPVVAILAGTVVWRLLVPDDPTPRRGAVAGVVTAFASLLGFALAFGVLAGLSELSQGAPFGAVSAFLTITALVFVFGSLLAGTVFAPLGALVGYAYEWYLARQ